MGKTYEHIIFNPMAEGLGRAMTEVGADAKLVNIVQHHMYESVAVFEVDDERSDMVATDSEATTTAVRAAPTKKQEGE